MRSLRVGLLLFQPRTEVSVVPRALYCVAFGQAVHLLSQLLNDLDARVVLTSLVVAPLVA